MSKYTVWGLDVWGHGSSYHEKYDDCPGDCDGYIVNDRFEAGEIEIVDVNSDENILQTLLTEGYICNVSTVEIDNVSDENLLFINYKEDSRPLFQLEQKELQ